MDEGVMSEDYSASSTLIKFDRPIPLLRGHVPAGSSDDPSLGPFVLAFKDAASWRVAYREIESKIIEDCLAGARIACAINASKKCSPPWWKNLIGHATDFAEREHCEEQEMATCLAAAREPCVRLAKEKCISAFHDARIAFPDFKQIPKTAASVPMDESSLLESYTEVTNFRGSALMQTSSKKQGKQ